MADINVIARKTGGGVVGTLVKGDSGAAAVRVIIPRWAGGADLSGLRWSVALRNAEGVEDVVEISEAEVRDSVITFLWRPGGAATDAPGDTRFDVAGMDSGGMVWGSAPYTLHIIDNLGIERAAVDVTAAICGEILCGEALCGEE